MTSHIYGLNKLVRDESISNMEEYGATVTYHRLSDADFSTYLAEKLLEEAHELAVAHTPENIREELADVLELVNEMATLHGIALSDLEGLRQNKAAKRGGYNQRYYVAHIACPPGSKWDVYCAADPAKYPRLDQAS